MFLFIHHEQGKFYLKSDPWKYWHFTMLHISRYVNEIWYFLHNITSIIQYRILTVFVTKNLEFNYIILRVIVHNIRILSWYWNAQNVESLTDVTDSLYHSHIWLHFFFVLFYINCFKMDRHTRIKLKRKIIIKRVLERVLTSIEKFSLHSITI